VAALQTEAVLDVLTDEWVVTTPDDGAIKWWIGNAAEDGKAATVFARLKVPAPDGEQEQLQCLTRLDHDSIIPCGSPHYPACLWVIQQGCCPAAISTSISTGQLLGACRLHCCGSIAAALSSDLGILAVLRYLAGKSKCYMILMSGS